MAVCYRPREPSPRRHSVPRFLQFVAFGSPQSRRLPKVGSIEQRPTPEPDMITAYFTFVTVAFFAAIVANVAASVAGATV